MAEDLRCPTCQKPTSVTKSKTFPFCCERCRSVDLYHWFHEDYSLPREGQSDAEYTDGLSDERPV